MRLMENHFSKTSVGRWDASIGTMLANRDKRAGKMTATGIGLPELAGSVFRVSTACAPNEVRSSPRFITSAKTNTPWRDKDRIDSASQERR